MVELREPPVDQPQRPPRVVDQDVVRLDVAVDDPVRVREVERLEQLVEVEADVVVPELHHQRLEVDAVDVLEDQRRRRRRRLHDDVVEPDDVRPAAQVLEDQDLPVVLLRLDGLEDLDRARDGLVDDDALEDVAVLPAADLADDPVRLLRAPVDADVLVVVERARLGREDVAVDAGVARGARRHVISDRVGVGSNGCALQE